MSNRVESIKMYCHDLTPFLVKEDFQANGYSQMYKSEAHPDEPEFYITYSSSGFMQLLDRFNIVHLRTESQVGWLTRMDGENNSFAELYLETSFKGLIPCDENGCHLLPNGDCSGELGCIHDAHSQYKALPAIMQYQEGAITLRELTNYLCKLIYPELYDQELLNPPKETVELPQLCHDWHKKNQTWRWSDEISLKGTP